MLLQIKKTENSPILMGPGMIMKISLFVSFLLHVFIFLIFQDAFSLQWDGQEVRTYRVELMRPPLEDTKEDEISEPEIERVKEEPKPPTEDSEATISLETQDERYMPYASILKEMISRHWIYPPDARENLLEGKLLVLFSLGKEGNLIQIKINKDSGYEILDQEAVRAIRTAAPFPSFPEHITVSRLHVNTRFEYRLTAKK